ncbi:MAG: acetylxylan esterase [Pirellulales bacterium]|nr:acetylxylan esterase [Pirellulales bacterium]
MYLAAWILAVGLAAASAEDLTVLQPDQSPAAPSLMLYEHLRAQANAALDRRAEEFEKVKTPEDARAYQQRRREFLLSQIGEFPERSPLNARVVGQFDGPGYRAEKVIYESQPNHHVTAVLYLPTSKAPYPGVLIPCGHSYNGKAAGQYQRIAILLAQHGLAALCYDPIGQGERYQAFGPDGKPLPNPLENTAYGQKLLDAIPGKPNFDCVQEHTLVGVGCILMGMNTARYRIFDGVRSLDYLASRPEIDPERLGCTGNSGGGTLTSYLMAVDDRIASAAPGCYLTTFRRLLEVSVPQDAEQNIHGQLAFGLEQADYVLLRAPKPTLICAATRDVTFDILGTWDLAREAKRFYARFGLPERVDIVETDAPHGFTVQLREGAVRWMRRWLTESDDLVQEGDFPEHEAKDLQCTSDGQVMFLPGECSVFELNRREEERLAQSRKQSWAGLAAAERLEAVRKVVGVRPLAELSRIKSRPAGKVDRPAYRIDKLVLESEAGIPLPALAFVPPQPAEEAVLYVHGQGKQADAQPGGPIEKLVSAGRFVLAVDLGGLGETQGRPPRDWSHGRFGPSAMEFFLAYMLDRSLVGMRAEEILSCARFLAEYPSADKPRKVHLVGVEAAGVPALHAAALEPDRFATVTLRRTLTSWSDVVRTPVCPHQLPNTVHGALAVYDLPDLVGMIDATKLTIEGPAGAAGPAD